MQHQVYCDLLENEVILWEYGHQKKEPKIDEYVRVLLMTLPLAVFIMMILLQLVRAGANHTVWGPLLLITMLIVFPAIRECIMIKNAYERTLYFVTNMRVLTVRIYNNTKVISAQRLNDIVKVMASRRKNKVDLFFSPNMGISTYKYDISKGRDYKTKISIRAPLVFLQIEDLLNLRRVIQMKQDIEFIKDDELAYDYEY